MNRLTYQKMKIPEKILVRSPNWVGDQILAYPFFYFLRKAYPSSHITVASVPWVQSIQFRNLVDEVLALPVPFQNNFSSRFRALESGADILKKAGRWDLAICLPNSFSSAWLIYRSGARMRRGYSTDSRRILLNQPIPWEKRGICHRADAYVRLLPEESGVHESVRDFWGVPPVNDLDPGTPGVLTSFNAQEAWPDSEPFDPPKEKYWILAPGSQADSRRWPVERFASLARQIASETGLTGIIIGGANEIGIAQKLGEDPSLKLLDWTGRGSVGSYWRIFKNALFSVCNDSGLAHVASLCGSPVQIIWGAGNTKRTEPLGPGKVQISVNPVDCWPCEQNKCFQPLGKQLECLKGIYSDGVWKEIKAGIQF